MSPLFNPPGAQPSIGGPIGDGTEGSVLFVGPGEVFAQNNLKLFWDDPNARLGIGHTTPSYPLHVLEIPTATSGTLAANSLTLVTNPSGASSAAYVANFVTCETASSNTQNHSTYITGSYYAVSHRGSGTLATAAAVTCLMQQDAAAGAITSLLGLTFQTSIAKTATLVAGYLWQPAFGAAAVVGTLASIFLGGPSITAGGTVGSSYGALLNSMGATGVTGAAGIAIAAQSGASVGNVGLLLGTQSIPSGSYAMYVAAGNIQLVGGVNIGLDTTTGTKLGTGTTQRLGFWNATPVVQPTVTGSRGGNAALASLLTQLATMGLVVDSSSA